MLLSYHLWVQIPLEHSFEFNCSIVESFKDCTWLRHGYSLLITYLNVSEQQFRAGSSALNKDIHFHTETVLNH